MLTSNKNIPEDIRVFFKKKFNSIDIKDTENIFELGLVDSLFAMQIVMFVENKFDFECTDEDLDIDNFCSIENISKFVSKKMGEIR